jgi:hypothetical protein
MNEWYPSPLTDADVRDLARAVDEGRITILCWSLDRVGFRRLDLGDERPTYAWSTAENGWVLVNVTRAKKR